MGTLLFILRALGRKVLLQVQWINDHGLALLGGKYGHKNSVFLHTRKPDIQEPCQLNALGYTILPVVDGERGCIVRMRPEWNALPSVIVAESNKSSTILQAPHFLPIGDVGDEVLVTGPTVIFAINAQPVNRWGKVRDRTWFEAR